MKKSNLFKRVLASVLCLVLMLTAVASAVTVSAETASSVVNTTTMITFEDGQLPEGVERSARASITTAPGEGHGSYSIFRPYASGNDTTLRVYTPFEAGHTYQISVDYYHVSNTDGHTTYVPWFAVWTEGKERGSKYDDASYDTWKRTSFTFTTTEAYRYLDVIVGACNTYLDNVYILDITNGVTSDMSSAPALFAGSNANVSYEYNAELGKNIAVGTIASGFSDANMLSVPMELKAGKVYDLVLTYKTDIWCCTYYSAKNYTTLDSYNAWQTVYAKVEVKADGDKFYIGTPANSAGGNVYISYISLTENTNTSGKQAYNFDTNRLTPISTYTPVDVTGADGKLTKAFDLSYPATEYGKKEAYTYLDAPLTAGVTYKFSFDYTGAGVIRHYFNNGGWTPNQCITAVAPETEVAAIFSSGNIGLRTNAGEWKNYTSYIVADEAWTGILLFTQNDPVFTGFEGGTAFYIDNIVIEAVQGYNISVGTAENGTATVSKTSALVGDTVTFSASADIGYMFAGWKDEEGNIVSYDSAYTVTVNSDLTLTPVFEIFKAVKVDFENGAIPAGITTVTLAENAGNGDYSVKHTAAGGYENVRFKNVKFISGHTYAISFDYKADSSVAAKNNYWMRLEVKSAADTDVTNNGGLVTAAANYDKWLTAGWIYTATEDGQYFSILLSDELYFDNIKIIDITGTEEYTEDFTDNTDFALIDLESALVDVDYVEDEELGKTVAAITYSRGSAGGFDADVALPFTLEDGVTYRIRLTYKSEGTPNGWHCYSFDGKNAHGSAVGINSAEWTTADWYITGSADQQKLYIGTNAASAVLYISSISVDIEKGKGDINNDGTVLADDLVLLRKILIKAEVDAFLTAADANEDGETDIRDLVRLKKITENITIADEAEALTLLSASENVLVEKSSNSQLYLGDGSRFKKAVSGKDSYIVYRILGSITEAAIECDFPVSKLGQFTFEVSDNMNDWTAVVPTAVSAQEINGNSWVRYTYYIGDLDYVSGLKINFPDNDEAGVRKVKINRVDDTVLYSLKGYDPDLRESANFYVDSISGNDSNNGLSAESAFKTLSAAFSRCFVPGDSILLARGGSYKGGVELHSSGSKTAPIKISAYGDGNAPVITDFANKVGLGIWGEYVEISEIEFTCPEGITAIGWYAVKSGASKGAVIKNCYFHHINSTETSTRFASYGTGGVAFYAQGNNPTWFDGAIVENNRFDTLGRDSVYFTSQWSCCDTEQGWGDRNLNAGFEAVRNRNIAVRNNSITANAGDAILLIGAKDSVIEYNTVANSILIGDRTEADPAWAAVWYHSSVNCVIQYNEVYGNSGANGGHDLQAFDLDIACRDCIVQYNYSHDNDGGFMLLCGTEAENGGGVSGAVIRYNLSVNDGAKGLSVFDITGSISNSAIYNNTVYCGKNDVKLVNLANYQKVSTLSENTVFTNNIFYAKEGVSVSFGYGDINTAPAFTDATFNKNVFYNISDPVWSGRINVTDSMNEDPLLADAGNTGNGFEAGQFYAPQSGSYVLEAGTIIENNGGKDFFGNTVSPQSTLIGAIIV